MTYKDAQGNEYRKRNDEWYVLVSGKGWQKYNGTAYIIVTSESGDGDVIQPVLPSIPPEQAEQEAVKRNRENELFVHIAVEQMKAIIATHEGYEMQSPDLAKSACDDAQAMIDELKERGRL